MHLILTLPSLTLTLHLLPLHRLLRIPRFPLPLLRPRALISLGPAPVAGQIQILMTLLLLYPILSLPRPPQ